MDHDVSNRSAARGHAGSVGLSALATLFVAAIPKCPLCWVALMSALGVGSVVNSSWLRPLAAALLVVSLGALFARSKRRRGFGPFYLGLAAALAIYLSKFVLDFDAGVYLGGATLIAAAVWNALPQRQRADARCRC